MRIDDAAALLGVSTSVLSRLENGAPVGTDRLLRIIQGLGLSLLVLPKADAAELLSGSGGGPGAPVEETR